MYASRVPQFLKTALPGYQGQGFHFVRHHVAHAASAALAAPWGPDGSLADCAVLAVDGRGESTSMLAGNTATASWICSRCRRCHIRSDFCTRI